MSNFEPWYQMQDRRKELKISVEHLAMQTGLAPGTIRAFEQGRRQPSLGSLRRLESALQMEFAIDRSKLVPFPGGHIRRTKEEFEEKDLRLWMIDRILHINSDKLNAIYTLLQD